MTVEMNWAQILLCSRKHRHTRAKSSSEDVFTTPSHVLSLIWDLCAKAFQKFILLFQSLDCGTGLFCKVSVDFPRLRRMSSKIKKRRRDDRKNGWEPAMMKDCESGRQNNPVHKFIYGKIIEPIYFRTSH